MSEYRRLRFRLPGEWEGELIADLRARGSIGMEVRAEETRVVVDAYFEAAPDPLVHDLESRWADRGVRLLGSEGVPDVDWLATHRSVSRPFEVGERWLIDPGEPTGPPPASPGRETLRVPARRAFGTGSHESTRLLLEWLEDLPLAGRRVLDLGTGSGILSLAAERLGATWTVGVDPDPVAIWVGRDNVRLNAGSLRLVAGDLHCLQGRVFDLALINILPSEWLADAPALGGALAIGADVLLSGIPTAEAEGLVCTIEDCGLAVREQRNAGDWIACRAEVVA